MVEMKLWLTLLASELVGMGHQSPRQLARRQWCGACQGSREDGERCVRGFMIQEDE